MSFNSGPIFTAAGEALLARALAGDLLTFTTMQMGDGSLGSTAVRDMTALVNSVASVDISTLRHRDNYATVSGSFTNADLTAGFYWREIGLFAADPDAPDDRSRDILYCYQNAGDLADYIPASDSELITKRINIAAIVGGAADVTAVLSSANSADMVSFDNTTTGMTAEDVQAAIEELHFMMGEIFDESDIDAIADKRARSLVAHNLVVDGGFEMGTQYWENYNPTYYTMNRSSDEYVHGYRCLKLTAAGAQGSSSNFFGPRQVFAAAGRLGHVIYFACQAKAAAGKKLAIALGYAGVNLSNYSQTATATGDWQRISRRISLSSGYYPNSIYLGFPGSFAAGDVAYFDDVLVVDLTDMFGAGNEPTQAWCDENIEYFNTAAAVNERKTLMLMSALETTVTT